MNVTLKTSGWLIAAMVAAQIVCLLLLVGALVYRGLTGMLVHPIETSLLVGAMALVLISSAGLTVMLRREERRLESANASLEDKVAQRSAELIQRRDAVIFGLAKLAESRDSDTGEHLERISRYVEVLAKQIDPAKSELDGGCAELLPTTAALHDIGKVAIPDAILLKPGPLTDEERAIMQRHPGIGGDMLIQLKQRWGEDVFLITASQIAFGHHEKWDGSGYPFGLRGEQIPLAARIVAVADVYDALRSARPYKIAMTHQDASQIIRDGIGTHFDPRVVQAFESVSPEFEAISNNGHPSADTPAE